MPGLVEHYFSASTIAGQEDVIRDDGGITVFVPAGKVLAERDFTPGTADILTRFISAARR